MKRESAGLVLIIMGALVWPIGFALGLKPVPEILIPHLALVLPGVYLKGSRILNRLKRK